MTLKSKFIFWVCLLFILMGLLIFIPLSIILPEKITALILRRDIKIAQYLSREVQEPLLLNNKLALKLLLADRLKNLGDCLYIFIRSRDGAIISSTFKKGFPKNLVNINPAPSGGPEYGRNNPGQDLYSISKFLVNGKKAYDIAIPLLGGGLGELHLGVSLESSKSEIAEFSRIKHYLVIVIFIGLGMGILIFTYLGIFLTRRIVKLKDFAAGVGRGDLNGKIDIKAKDEIGNLAASFNNMVLNLKEKIETIKRLSYLEERSRIAVEFHDGLAQDLADIIKRLELCERLFRINQARAFEELGALMENTREVLNKTRQVISNLNSPQGADFNLLSSLNNYLKNFQQQNEINVKIDVAGSLDSLPAQKARAIFYIIAEAFANIRKHAQANNAWLHLSYSNEELVIAINDDGKGFNLNAAELSASVSGKSGLISMRQRTISLGGKLAINSTPGQGTAVRVKIPLKEEKA